MIRQRTRLALLQREVAERLKVHSSTYRKWEKDRLEPLPRYAPRVADFLGMDPSQITRPVRDRLNAARRRLGMSEDDLALLLRIDPGAVRRAEEGSRSIGRVAAKLEGWLALVEGANDREPGNQVGATEYPHNFMPL